MNEMYLENVPDVLIISEDDIREVDFVKAVVRIVIKSDYFAHTSSLAEIDGFNDYFLNVLVPASAYVACDTEPEAFDLVYCCYGTVEQMRLLSNLLAKKVLDKDPSMPEADFIEWELHEKIIPVFPVQLPTKKAPLIPDSLTYDDQSES